MHDRSPKKQNAGEPRKGSIPAGTFGFSFGEAKASICCAATSARHLPCVAAKMKWMG
jgi:hypothetical protein